MDFGLAAVKWTCGSSIWIFLQPAATSSLYSLFRIFETSAVMSSAFFL